MVKLERWIEHNIDSLWQMRKKSLQKTPSSPLRIKKKSSSVSFADQEKFDDIRGKEALKKELMYHAETMFCKYMQKKKQDGIKFIKDGAGQDKEYGIKNIFIDSGIEKNFQYFIN